MDSSALWLPFLKGSLEPLETKDIQWLTCLARNEFSEELRLVNAQSNRKVSFFFFSCLASRDRQYLMEPEATRRLRIALKAK